MTTDPLAQADEVLADAAERLDALADLNDRLHPGYEEDPR